MYNTAALLVGVSQGKYWQEKEQTKFKITTAVRSINLKSPILYF